MKTRIVIAAAIAAFTLVCNANAEDALKAKLDKKVTLEFHLSPLGDALGVFRESYQLPIDVNAQAFRNAIGVNDVATQQVTLEKVKDIRLGRALEMLLEQVDGAYLIKDERIQVAPRVILFEEMKLQKMLEFDRAARELKRQMETLEDARRMAMVQFNGGPGVATASDPAPDKILERLELIEKRLTEIEKKLGHLSEPRKDKVPRNLFDGQRQGK